MQSAEKKKKKYRERIFVYTSLVCCHNNNLRFKDPSRFVRKRYYHSSYIIIWNNIYIYTISRKSLCTIYIIHMNCIVRNNRKSFVFNETLRACRAEWVI